MKVSVLMPMKNAVDFVQDAINSVLNTVSLPLELIVIDDGSTDGSRALVESFTDPRLVIVDGPQMGIAACLNKGITHATGELLMRCDADDLYPPDRIERQRQWLMDNPNYIAVCGGFEMMNKKGEVISSPFLSAVEKIVDITDELQHGILRTSLCTFCIKKSIIDRMGAFRTYFETAEDIDLALRLGNYGPIAFIGKNFYFYRIHDTSITHTQVSKRRIFFDEIAILFASQRLKRGADDLIDGNPPLIPANIGAASTANQHVLDLMTGNIWRNYQLKNHKKALTGCLQLIKNYPTNKIAWSTSFKLIIKLVFRL